MNHPMFRNDATSGAGGATPSSAEIDQIKTTTKFLTIKADDVKDPDWYLHNQMAGGPGLQKKMSEETSMYEQKKWRTTTHADPSKNQKRKNQINYLAHAAIEKE